MKEIPVIDLNNKFGFIKNVETIGQAFKDIGFIFVKTSNITDMLPEAYIQFRKLFNLSYKTKSRYAHPEIFYQRGWTPPFTEVGIACRSIGKDGQAVADAKEAWFIGPELEPEHYLIKQFPQLYPQNIWPSEVPEFKPTMLELRNSLFLVGKEVLRLLEHFLGYSKGTFDEMLRDSPTIMRAINYPPIFEEEVGKIVWACSHTDINLVTVLPASTRSGLWIRRRDGEWIPGNAPSGCTIVQVADMLDYLTAGFLMSAAHEVRAPKHPTLEGRLSAALFMHARSDVTLDPKVEPPLRQLYPPITAGELLLKRLAAINLAK